MRFLRPQNLVLLNGEGRTPVINPVLGGVTAHLLHT
jgi:hypothetical protein